MIADTYGMSSHMSAQGSEKCGRKTWFTFTIGSTPAGRQGRYHHRSGYRCGGRPARRRFRRSSISSRVEICSLETADEHIVIGIPAAETTGGSLRQAWSLSLQMSSWQITLVRWSAHRTSGEAHQIICASASIDGREHHGSA